MWTPRGCACEPSLRHPSPRSLCVLSRQLPRAKAAVRTPGSLCLCPLASCTQAPPHPGRWPRGAARTHPCTGTRAPPLLPPMPGARPPPDRRPTGCSLSTVQSPRAERGLKRSLILLFPHANTPTPRNPAAICHVRPSSFRQGESGALRLQVKSGKKTPSRWGDGGQRWLCQALGRGSH